MDLVVDTENLHRFINLFILALMAAACGIADSVLEHRDYKRQAPWLYGDNTSGDNSSINGLVTFAFALITYVARSFPYSSLTTFPLQLPEHCTYLSIHLYRVCSNMPGRIYLL